jgi:arylsulfatase
MNVLWFCTDQQRFDTLGCYGNPFVRTPNLDRLAAMGMRFTRAYAQSPVCAPSRASFLTGRYPRVCLRQNGQDIRPEERLIPKILSEAGYTCGLSGKLHLAACNPSTHRVREPRIDDGYDYFRWSHHPGAPGGNNWPTNDYTLWLTSQGATYQTPPCPESSFVETGMPEALHQTTWCVDRALEYIQSAHSYRLPWLFSVNVFAPHHPFNPPREYLERYLDHLDDIPLPNYLERELDEMPEFQTKDHRGAYDMPGNYPFTDFTDRDHRVVRAAYWAMIDHVDHQFGRLLDYLEQSGQLVDTLILFTSDHGENLGDHGMYLKGPYFYENNVRVPLIIAWPGTIPGGRTSDALVELTDLAPTLCQAAGLPPEPGMQGASLLPLLLGEAPADHHRDSVYSEYYNANVNHRHPLAFATMVFDGRYKLVKIHAAKGSSACEGELYDLAEDPTETHNLYNRAEYLEIRARMLALMADRVAHTCDPLPLRHAFW